jgi:hypothetical protein
MVTEPTPMAEVAAPDQRPRLAVASASLYMPDARRRLPALSIRCPHCHQVHLGRARSAEEADGPRRMACGRLALVVVHRRYGRPETAA